MKRIWFIAIVLISCTETKPEDTLIQSTSNHDEIPIEKPFANPARMYGTDFLSFLSETRITGEEKDLLRYTSHQSKTEHSIKDIIGFYNHTNINLEKKLKSIRKINPTLFVLNYSTTTFATRNIMTVSVSIENDTARLLLPLKLNHFLD